MDKHTPGPWRYEQFVPNTPGDFHVIRNGECGYVATTWGGLNEPDARLIAAAPELLEALQDVLRVMEEHEQLAGCASIYGDNARAAIAKATGEQA